MDDAPAGQRFSGRGHPLDSSRLKLARAREHLEALADEARAFLETQPFFYVPYPDTATGRHEIRARKMAEPPLRLGLLAADAIHNFRSALDHLVHEVAALGPRGVAGRGERTQFPIFDRKKDFDRNVAIYLQGVPKDAVEVFELLQPYHGGEELIANIAKLDDRDKHRALSPVVSAPHRGELILIEGRPTKVEIPPGITHIEDGTVVCVYWTAPSVHLTARYELVTTIVFGEPGAVSVNQRDLANFGNFVDAVLLAFIPLFDRPTSP